MTGLDHDDPEDACLTTAFYLNVAIDMIAAAGRRADGTDRESDDGGYGLSIARELLGELRDYLRKSAELAATEQHAEKGGT